jgi:glyoxylase-like metal-dependent hydrolase (beta-lactamase superfamily II)
MPEQKHDNRYILHQLSVGALETNCYIFGSSRTRQVAIIDPGADHEIIKALLEKESLQALFIINTHGHADHTGADFFFDLPVYIHKDDAGFLKDPAKSLSLYYPGFQPPQEPGRLLSDGDIIDIADIKLKVVHTPGHTPGGISLYADGILFSGDSLFCNSVGRTDLPYGDHDKLISSINNKLMVLDEGSLVLPGHGQSTTIAAEKANNPWLK